MYLLPSIRIKRNQAKELIFEFEWLLISSFFRSLRKLLCAKQAWYTFSGALGIAVGIMISITAFGTQSILNAEAPSFDQGQTVVKLILSENERHIYIDKTIQVQTLKTTTIVAVSRFSPSLTELETLSAGDEVLIFKDNNGFYKTQVYDTRTMKANEVQEYIELLPVEFCLVLPVDIFQQTFKVVTLR